MLNPVGEISIDIQERESCVFIAEKGEPISEGREENKHGMNSVTIGGRVGERIGTGRLRSEGGVGEEGGLQGNNGALGVRNESTELIVAIEEGGDELLIVEGVEGDAPPIHFNGDSVGIVQCEITHIGDETFTGFLDMRGGNSVNSIAGHKACA